MFEGGQSSYPVSHTEMTEVSKSEKCNDLGKDPNNFLLSAKQQYKQPIIVLTSDNKENELHSYYRFETNRLKSFLNWPLSYPNLEKLAAAGLYHTGERDKVKCFDCHVIIDKWQYGDDPWITHQNRSIMCRFIRNLPCGNVSIGANFENVPIDTNGGYVQIDTIGGNVPIDANYGNMPIAANCGNSILTGQQTVPDASVMTNYHSNRSISNIPTYFTSNSENPTMVSLNDLKNACNPELGIYKERLKSFDWWPPWLTQSKEDMAAAGFFYSGKDDLVICYCCGVGLFKWERNEDPIQEHIKASPHCKYINLKI